MDASKHAILATLYPTTQKFIRDAAMGGGVGIDDLVQALLARDDARPPAYAKVLTDLAEKMRGAYGEHFDSDLAKLAETWPQPEHAPVAVGTQGAHIIDTASMDAAIAYARSSGRVFPMLFDFAPAHAVRIYFRYVWQTESEVPEEGIPVTPEDAAALLPLLVIDELPAIVLVSGGTLKPGGEELLATLVKAHLTSDITPEAPPAS